MICDYQSLPVLTTPVLHMFLHDRRIESSAGRDVIDWNGDAINVSIKAEELLLWCD